MIRLKENDHFAGQIVLTTTVCLRYTDNNAFEWGSPSSEKMSALSNVIFILEKYADIVLKTGKRDVIAITFTLKRRKGK